MKTIRKQLGRLHAFSRAGDTVRFFFVKLICDLAKMPKGCVAFGCTNHNMMGKAGLSFHIFPNKDKKQEKWQKWVQALKRVSEDGSPRYPKGNYVYLCSEHFISGKYCFAHNT